MSRDEIEPQILKEVYLCMVCNVYIYAMLTISILDFGHMENSES